MRKTDNSQSPRKAMGDITAVYADGDPSEQKSMESLIGGVVSCLKCVSNSQQALDVLDAGPVDLVIMDLHMADMHGAEATLKIRESGQVWAAVPIIALSNSLDYRQRNICREIGMNVIIAKPVARGDLLDALAEVSLLPLVNHG